MDALRRVKMTLVISFLLVCWMTSFGTNLVQGCESDSECYPGYSCCKGTIYCCRNGYLCTGSATCLTVWVIIGPVVAVVFIIVAVALWCYRRRRAAS